MKKLLNSVNLGQEFMLNNGLEIKNLNELSETLKAMSNEVFEHHANGQRHDFSNWVGDAVGDSVLKNRISKIFDKNQLSNMVSQRINEINQNKLETKIDFHHNDELLTNDLSQNMIQNHIELKNKLEDEVMVMAESVVQQMETPNNETSNNSNENVDANKNLGLPTELPKDIPTELPTDIPSDNELPQTMPEGEDMVPESMPPEENLPSKENKDVLEPAKIESETMSPENTNTENTETKSVEENSNQEVVDSNTPNEDSSDVKKDVKSTELNNPENNLKNEINTGNERK